MIARPPEKKSSSQTKAHTPFYIKVANDNRPPKKVTIGWILFVMGFLLLASTFFWA
jgi:hypothetical protein